jgi:pentatricopeptide repeat domain-containing protein 1
MTLLRPRRMIVRILLFTVGLFLHLHFDRRNGLVRILPLMVDVNPSRSSASRPPIRQHVCAFAMVLGPRPRPKVTEQVPAPLTANFAKRTRLYTTSPPLSPTPSSSNPPTTTVRRRTEHGTYHGQQAYSKDGFHENHGNNVNAKSAHSASASPSSSLLRRQGQSCIKHQQQDERRRQQDLVVLFQNALDEKYDSNSTKMDQSLLQLTVGGQQTEREKENVTQTLITLLSCPGDDSSSKLGIALSRALVQRTRVQQHEDSNNHHHQMINLACAFVKALANRRAFAAMESFVRHVLPPSLQTCTVYSTALSALTSSSSSSSSARAIRKSQYMQRHQQHELRSFPRHDHGIIQNQQSERALRLWNDMKRLELVPTSYTLTGLFRAMNGPQQVWDICTQVRARQQQQQQQHWQCINVTAWTRPVYEAAIRACARGSIPQQSPTNNLAWNTALHIWHWMRDDSTNIQPTVDTYSALLQVCAVTSNLTAALYLLDHEILAKNAVSRKNFNDNDSDQANRRVIVQRHPLLWDAILNVCVSCHDDATCLHLLHRMYHELEMQPNVHHCTAYLKCLLLLKKDVQAVDFVMNTMMISPTSSLPVNGDHVADTSHKAARLQTAPPDLVAIHTALAACASTRNYKLAKQLLDHVVLQYRSGGDDGSHDNNVTIVPNQQTYHWVLAACQNGQEARDIIQAMRLSRRHRSSGGRTRIGTTTTTRHVVVPPTLISYTKAIVACRQVGDLETALWLLRTAALDDGLELDVYIYSSVIWTAAAAKDWQQARALVEEMKSRGCMPTIVTYNGLLTALQEASCGDKNDEEHRFEVALVVLDAIHLSGVVSTKSTFSQMTRLATLTASDSQHQRQLARLERVYHEKMTSEEKQQVAIGGPILRALINAYGAQGQYAQARQIFDTISPSCNDIGCIRSMLFACSTAKLQPAWQEALEILYSTNYTMTSDNRDGDARTIVLPAITDSVSVSSTMLACSKADQWQESFNLWRGVTHEDGGDSRRNNSSISLLALNSLIAACGRAGRADMAIQVLNDMESGGLRGRGNVVPDERSYRNAIIACNQAEHGMRRLLLERQQRSRRRKESKQEDYAKLSNGLFEWWECALSLLRRMQENGLSPDIQTFSSAISACEAAGQWQRALSILQSILDRNDNDDKEDPDERLNLYCFNAALSACQKGGAWIECLEIYERMKSHGGVLTPNSVSLSSLVLACEEAGQKELAMEKYKEGIKQGIIPSPWRTTTKVSMAISRNATKKQKVIVPLRAMDLHHYSAAMAKAAVRSYLDSLLASRNKNAIIDDHGWTIIVGKGLRSRDNEPVLLPTLRKLLEHEYDIDALKSKSSENGENNIGRLIVDADTLRQFVAAKRWRV